LGILYLTGMAERIPQGKTPLRMAATACRIPAPQFISGEPHQYQGQRKPTAGGFREGHRVRTRTKVHGSPTSFMTFRGMQRVTDKFAAAFCAAQ
jgi:hypothetical protein